MIDVSPKPVASRRARLHNLGDSEYVEKYKNKEIRIPARGFVEMDFYDAVHFKGQFTPAPKNEVGQYLRTKPLKLEKLPMLGDQAKMFISPADGEVFRTQQELDTHLKLNSEKWDSMTNPELDAQLEKKEALKQEEKPSSPDVMDKVLEALTTLEARLSRLEIKKGGRPRKAKSDAAGDHR